MLTLKLKLKMTWMTRLVVVVVEPVDVCPNKLMSQFELTLEIPGHYEVHKMTTSMMLVQ
jgi:hypothetical protein